MNNKEITVVTGGASGIGLACAKTLGRHGPVVISGRHENRLAAANEELTKLGIESFYYVAGSSNLDEVKALGDFAASKGTVKRVINCAGLSGDSPDATARKVLEVNALGTVNAVKTFYPLLGEDAVQINIASMGRLALTLQGMDENDFAEAFRKWDSPEFVDELMKFIADTPEAPDHAYTISKAFVAWFSKANTRRYAGKGARILTISPGHFNTRMMKDVSDSKPEIAMGMKMANPRGRWGETEEIGVLADFLCSHAADYITGTDILIDGGFSTANFLMREDQIPG